MGTTEIPRGDSGPRYVRLQAELVLEVTSAQDLRAAALAGIDTDTFMPRPERTHALAAVGADESEALAYLVDPSEWVAGIPGVELVQASWSFSHTEYHPDDEGDRAGRAGAGGGDEGEDGEDEIDAEDLPT
jgi:hypothetical protein